MNVSAELLHTGPQKCPVHSLRTFLVYSIAGFLGIFIVRASVSAQSAFQQQVALPHVLHSRVHTVVTNMTPLGRLPATNRLNLVIGLPWRNEADLEVFLNQLHDPGSTNFDHFLTPNQFTARFGPTEVDYQSVINFAKTNDLQVVGTDDGRKILDVSATVFEIEKAFHINLNIYQHPTEARHFYAPNIEPTVDSRLPILDVSGLDSFVRPHPMAHLKTTTGKAEPASGSGFGGSYRGYDFRNAYAPGVSLNGSGQNVGLVELEGYYPTDISAYENQSTPLLPQVPLLNKYSDGMTATPDANDPIGIGECSLDIEMAISMAPGLTAVYVFEGNVTDHIFKNIVANPQIFQISSSWALTYDLMAEGYLQQMAGQGQTFFQASGDGDAWVNPIAWPCDDPNVTSVGGTTLSMNGSGASYSSETVWNSGNLGASHAWPLNGDGYWGSGGGVSSRYSIPSWQKSVNMTAVGGSSSQRNIPDVALVADNVWVIYDSGLSASFIGTSIAAPLWAGFMALVNQERFSNGAQPMGFLNPALYAIGQGANYTACFNDITTGNNTSLDNPKNFYAAFEYDLCTGWGTISGANLINALQPQSNAITNPSTLFSYTITASGTQELTNYTPQAFTWTVTASATETYFTSGTATWGPVALYDGQTSYFPSPGSPYTAAGNSTFTVNYYGFHMGWFANVWVAKSPLAATSGKGIAPWEWFENGPEPPLTDVVSYTVSASSTYNIEAITDYGIPAYVTVKVAYPSTTIPNSTTDTATTSGSASITENQGMVSLGAINQPRFFTDYSG
jgi:subtilase family serine protease